MVTIIDKQCDCIVEVVRMIKAQVEDAESPECRANNCMFAPVPCEGLEAANNLLRELIMVFDTSYGEVAEEVPVMLLANQLAIGVDKIIDVARMGGIEDRRNDVLTEHISWFYMQVKAIEAVNLVRLEK